jgi:hypothetical protein
VSKNLLEKMIQDNSLSAELADEYLKIYIADIDWIPHITKLWNNFYNKNKDEEQSKELVKKAISCTVLLPITDNTQIPNPPHRLLFWCTGWVQFNEKDWFSIFKETIEKDLEIKNNRKEVISSGIIDPIDYSPITRQAFNWLYEKAQASGDITEENKDLVVSKLTNLVKIYGGAVICSIFLNHENLLDKVLNWRSGYFFEKQIYKVYSVEKIHKIKSMEFKKTNSSYIRK